MGGRCLNGFSLSCSDRPDSTMQALDEKSIPRVG